MRCRDLAVLLVVLAGTCGLATAQPQESPGGLQDGIRQYEQAEYLRAIVTLDQLVQSLKQDQRQAGTLAQALLYLGMSHLALNQESAAKMRFRSAIEYMLVDARARGKAQSAADLMLDAALFSPKVIDMFEAAKSEFLRASAAEPPEREEKPAPAAAPRPAVATYRSPLIRYRTGGEGWIEARLLRVNRGKAPGEDSLEVLSRRGTPAIVPLDSVLEIQSRSTRRRTLEGLAIGGGLGVATGFAMPVDASDCGPDSQNMCSRSQALIGGTVGFGGIGALIGALIHTDSWRRVAPGDLHVQLGPTGRGRLGVEIAWRF